MKQSMISTSWIFFAIFTLVTACGQSDQSETTKKPPNNRGKPTAIAKDEATSTHALLLTASLVYVQQSVHDLVTLGELDAGCRRLNSIEGVPTAKLPSERMRLVVKNNCPTAEGFEEFAADNVRRINDTERKLKLQFDRATLNTNEPLFIRRRAGLDAQLMMQNQLVLELTDATANTYSFKLITRWFTPEDNKPGKRTRGVWTVNLSGRIRAIGGRLGQATTATEVYDLVSSVEGQLSIPGRTDKQLDSLETSSLNASATENKVAINACGYPESIWASVYKTSLFPSEQLDLNFQTRPRRLSNFSTNIDHDLNPCTTTAWAFNAIKAMLVLKTARSL